MKQESKRKRDTKIEKELKLLFKRLLTQRIDLAYTLVVFSVQWDLGQQGLKMKAHREASDYFVLKRRFGIRY